VLVLISAREVRSRAAGEERFAIDVPDHDSITRARES